MTQHVEVDIEDPIQLHRYLEETNRIRPDEPVEFVKLDGGVSNRTVWVKREQKPDWIMKQALEKLRVAVDWFSAPERIHREAAGLRRLMLVVPDNVPAFVFEDVDLHILAMSAIPQPHDNWKTQLLHHQPMIKHAVQFGELLAHIHNASVADASIADNFYDTTFFEELRLEPYYTYTAMQVPAASEFLHQLIADTRGRKQALVHGDYSPKNVLLHEDRLYILDYEVIHYGDPAFDMGFSMTHLLSKAHYRRAHRQTFLAMASAYWQAYTETIAEQFTSQSLELYAVRHTLACLLARVAGRSPLEYLNDSQREQQRNFVLALMQAEIETIPELISQIKTRLEIIHADD